MRFTLCTLVFLRFLTTKVPFRLSAVCRWNNNAISRLSFIDAVCAAGKDVGQTMRWVSYLVVPKNDGVIIPVVFHETPETTLNTDLALPWVCNP